MSTRAVSLLRELGLLDRQGVPAALTGMDADDLRARLEQYFVSRSTVWGDELESLGSDSVHLPALLGSPATDKRLESVIANTLVYGRVYLSDPVYRAAYPRGSVERTHNTHIGVSNELDVQSIQNALAYIAELGPLIAEGYVALLPLYAFQAPLDPAPLRFSEDGFRSQVPKHLYQYIHDSASLREVRPAKKSGAMLLLDAEVTQPVRGISVRFAGDESVDPRSCPFYVYNQIVGTKDLGGGELAVAMKVDWDTPPAQEEFDVWVHQTVNQTVLHRLNLLSAETRVATALNASYLTESGFEAHVCGVPSDDQRSVPPEELAVNFLRANLPFIRTSVAADIARLRRTHEHAFDRLHSNLLAVSNDLSGVSAGFEQKAQALFTKEIAPQADELADIYRSAAANVAAGALATVGSVSLAVLGGANLPFAAILGFGAMASGSTSIPALSELIAKRRGPAFIWSKLLARGPSSDHR